MTLLEYLKREIREMEQYRESLVGKRNRQNMWSMVKILNETIAQVDAKIRFCELLVKNIEIEEIVKLK